MIKELQKCSLLMMQMCQNSYSATLDGNIRLLKIV